MLHERIQQRQQRDQLAQIVADMPEFPIYRERAGLYSIYVEGECQQFASADAARLGQLAARQSWLRRCSAWPSGASEAR